MSQVDGTPYTPSERHLLVVEELASVSGARRLADYSSLNLPLLSEIANEASLPRRTRSSVAPVGENASIQDLLDEAVRRMPTKANSEAADTLVGSTDLRWTNSGERRYAAGRTLGVAAETFRKNYEAAVLSELAATILHEFAPESARSTNGSRGSRRVLTALGLLGLSAVAILLLVPNGSTSTATDAPSPTSTSEAAGNGTTSTTVPTTTTAESAASPTPSVEYVPTGPLDVTLYCTDILGVGAAAEVTGNEPSDWSCRNGSSVEIVDFDAACQVAYGPATQASNDGSGPYAWACVSPPVLAELGQCAIAPGAYDPDFQYDLGPYAQSFADRGSALASEGLCATTVVHRAGEGVIQQFHDPSSPARSVAAVLARSPNEEFVTLSATRWTAFQQVAGLEAGLVGYPLSEETLQPDGSWWVPFSVGGGLVAATKDGQYQWMPAVAHGKWKSLGAMESCLREPVSNPYPVTEGFQQDFAGGNLLLNFTTGELVASGDSCPSEPYPED